MKAFICMLMLTCLSLPARSEDWTKLEVHEWGTITVLSGSDGMPLKWYQDPSATDAVPGFVIRNPLFSKSSFLPDLSFVRMETPVIYFYPKMPMRVNVSTAFKDGQITEWFPTVKRIAELSIMPSAPLTWEGDLAPPGDAVSKAQIPEVSAGPGDHYRHAREVPGAWIFRSTTPARRGKDDPATGKDAEKFIFYRGKGQGAPPYRALAGSDGSYTLRSFGLSEAISSAFALSVRGSSARWSRMPQLGAANFTDRPESVAKVEGPEVPIDKAAGELAQAMREALTTAGLTEDEARSMVATWDGHWFREPGTRMLAILPQSWVDSVLPLTIKPAPTKVTRVFVARFEVLTPQRENEALALLNEKSTDAALVTRLKDLQLGRFARGALTRAQAMQSYRMSQQFEMLQQAAMGPHEKGKATAAVR